jgi:chromosome segregation ATPase
MSSSTPPDRLDQIQQELAGILEARLATLTTTLQATEATSRRIVAAEMEIQRASRDQTRLTAEIGQIEADAQSFLEQREALTSKHSTALKDREKKLKALEALQQVVASADAENSTAKSQLAALEAQERDLTKENSDLKAKLRTIEENIARMTALRDEIMHSISDQSAYMKRLAGADTD